MLTKPPESQAAEYANGLLNTLNQTLSRAQALTTNGAPANPQLGIPAVPATAVTAALGAHNTTVLQLLIAAVTTTDTTKLENAITALA